MQSIRVPAFAKVNLRLDVLGRRSDGYHELRTIFQALTLHDTLEISRTRGREIAVSVVGNAALSAAPARDNLVWRALSALRSELKLAGGVRAELQKRIPVGRGLGGGSSDAASALAGLLRLSGKRMPRARLFEIAASLGADVPFFLFGGRALGTSRGDEIYPLGDLPRRTVLVISPSKIAVRTADAYRWIDKNAVGSTRAHHSHAGRSPRARLTKGMAPHRLWSFCALCWSPQGERLSNDFEKPVFRRHPRLGKLRRALLERGALEAALAGSGSAVFGIFRSPAQARRAARMFPEDEVFLCHTLSRKAYVRALWGSARAPVEA
jgi:4-diphosphocytidyl-2-C-methyl-D-erythritol kinase